MNALLREVTDDAEPTAAYVCQEGPRVEYNLETVITVFIDQIRGRIFGPLRKGIIAYDQFSFMTTMGNVIKRRGNVDGKHRKNVNEENDE